MNSVTTRVSAASFLIYIQIRRFFQLPVGGLMMRRKTKECDRRGFKMAAAGVDIGSNPESFWRENSFPAAAPAVILARKFPPNRRCRSPLARKFPPCLLIPSCPHAKILTSNCNHERFPRPHRRPPRRAASLRHAPRAAQFYTNYANYAK